ncbi:MAG TPA: hypothetical protein VK163_02265 [Opitutaceae bacterium]|nr:hypothetical protein [Opitutaceae bacterium]
MDRQQNLGHDHSPTLPTPTDAPPTRLPPAQRRPGLRARRVVRPRAEPTWNALQAPHFLIISQRPERETREWATQFEQFILTLRDTLKFEEPSLPPLTVVLFANESRFSRYRPLDAKGRKREVAGFFSTRDTWSVIGLPGGFVDEETRGVVLHEATHWLVSSTRTELPLWLNEGFAEVFSKFEARKDYVLLGQPIEYHVDTLSSGTWAPLGQMMLTGYNDRLYTDSYRNRFFYAEAWLFVHRLMFGDRKAGYAALNTFFAARCNGADQITAFRKAFGQEPEQADSELDDYFRHGRFKLTKLPLPPKSRVDAPFRPATPYEIEIALARVAQGAGLAELANKHLEQALALDPAQPSAYELVAFRESQQKNHEAACTAARSALDRGSRDGWMHILAADALWRRYVDRGELAEKSREISAHYLTAAELQPRLRAPYNAYAQLARSFPSVTQTDADFLETGYSRFPDETTILIGLAVVMQKGNNPAGATKLLEVALARGDRLTDEQRTTAERLRAQWQVEPLAKQIEALTNTHKFVAALAACDELLANSLPFEDRRYWQRRRADLFFHAALEAADEEGRDEAIRRLEGLLANASLSAQQRTIVQLRLDRLRR